MQVTKTKIRDYLQLAHVNI